MAETSENSIGGMLRAERLSRGKALDSIAAETKISRAILEAIENDRFDAVPGGAYRRNFLRQYASAVGLDEEETVAAFLRQYDDIPVSLPSVPKLPPSGFLREAAFILLAGVAVAGFYKVAKDRASQYRYLAIKAPPTVKPKSKPVVQSNTEARPSASVHAVFTMTEPVWISVSCDGKPTYTGTLSQAESKSFEASAEVTVLVGNAGGLKITLNGRPVGPIGAHGEIQLLELTAEGTRRLTRSQGSLSTRQTGPDA
jgi:cytoskeletal protein RodZ